MKKFIFLLAMTTSLSLVNAQKVIGIYFNNQGSPMNLNGAQFNNMPQNTQINFPIIVVYQNTGANLNAGDSLYLYMENNDSELGTLKLYFNSTVEADSISYVSLPLQVSSSIFQENNEWCFSCTKAIRSGVEETLTEDPYCVDFTVNFTTSITEATSSEARIYPNPVKDVLKINNVTNSDVYIYNTLGQMIKKISSVMGNTEINVSDLNNGIYIVKIQNGNDVQTKKIQISK